MQELDVNYDFEKINENEEFKYTRFITEEVAGEYVFKVVGTYAYNGDYMPFNYEVKRVPSDEFESTMIRLVFFANRLALNEQVIERLRKDHPVIQEEIKVEQEEKQEVLLQSDVLEETKSLIEPKKTTGRKKKS